MNQFVMYSNKWLLFVTFLVLHGITMAQTVPNDYDLYPFGWVGLPQNTNTNGSENLGSYRRYIQNELPKAKRTGNKKLENDFLPLWSPLPNVPISPQIGTFSLLNFIACDGDVMTLHHFVLDNQQLRRQPDQKGKSILFYHSIHVEGKSDAFESAAKTFADSIRKYLLKPLSPPTEMQQMIWLRLLDACLFKNEQEHLGLYNMKRDTTHAKDYEIKDLMDAVRVYIQKGNAQYFDDWVDYYNKTSNNRRRNKFEKHYKRFWVLANALKQLHNTSKYLALIGSNSNTIEDDKSVAEKAMDRFLLFAKDSLRNTPLDKVERNAEYKEWTKYAKQLQLDSIATNLELSARLINSCKEIQADALNAENQQDYQKALSLYMSVVRNQDVADILKDMSKMGKNCGDFKKTAYARIDTLRKKLGQFYMDSLTLGDELLSRNTLEDSLEAVAVFKRAYLLNEELSYFGLRKAQSIYEALGDKARESYCYDLSLSPEDKKKQICCDNAKVVKEWYFKANDVAKTERNEVLLKQCAEIDRFIQNVCHSNDPYIPLPPGFTDTIPAENAGYIVDEIIKPFLRDFNLTHKSGLSNLDQIMTNSFRNGLVTVGIEAKKEGLTGWLSQMRYPMGEFIGEPFTEEQIVRKLATAIKEAYQIAKSFNPEDIFESIRIRHVGSADAHGFGSHCIKEYDIFPISKHKVRGCDENLSGIDFGQLACSDSNDDKNAALAFMRAYRRKTLIDSYLPDELRRFNQDPTALCYKVSPHKGAQYRYAETFFEMKLKPQFITKLNRQLQ
jgi:hypothetical protein